MRALIAPLALGLLGCAVLAGFGVWQLQRLAWKEDLLARIEARIAADPVALPERPERTRDAALAVALQGEVAGPAMVVFDTWRGFGAGVRAIVPVATGDRRVLVDLGAAPWPPGTDPAAVAGDAPAPGTTLAVTGNLDWPEEGAGTAQGALWSARDVPAMAAAAGAEPVLVTARATTPATAFAPLAVGTEGIPNSHLGYAVQWFGLALVWAGMTGFYCWRITRRTA